MSEPFLGEIRIVGFTFPPPGWADCNGQLLQISQYSALFSLFGTNYGGDGRTSFGLPDLRSRIPIHTGRGPGLSNRRLGETGGAETASQVAPHSHFLTGGSFPSTTAVGNQSDPDGHIPAKSNDGESNYSDENTTGSMELNGSTGSTGSSNANNMPPFLTLRFVVALVGVYPSSS